VFLLITRESFKYCSFKAYRVIEVEELCKSYGSLKAVSNLSFSVKEGEVFGFLGPNGAGKTTTLNMLMGLVVPDSGRITVAGVEVVEHPLEVRRVAGYLPENPGFYPWMSVLQNMLYFADFYGLGRAEAEELLELVGMAGHSHRKAGELSKGMRQRLALAQALLNDPEVLLLDEPTSGLDPEGAAEFRELVRRLSREGRTILFSSHILPEVTEVCRSVGIIHRGRLVVQGELKKLSKMRGFRVVVETQPPLPQEDAERLLGRFARRIERRDGSYVLDCPEDTRASISRELFRHGYAVTEIHAESPSLEELYLEVVRGSE